MAGGPQSQEEFGRLPWKVFLAGFLPLLMRTACQDRRFFSVDSLFESSASYFASDSGNFVKARGVPTRSIVGAFRLVWKYSAFQVSSCLHLFSLFHARCGARTFHYWSKIGRKPPNKLSWRAVRAFLQKAWQKKFSALGKKESLDFGECHDIQPTPPSSSIRRMAWPTSLDWSIS